VDRKGVTGWVVTECCEGAPQYVIDFLNDV